MAKVDPARTLQLQDDMTISAALQLIVAECVRQLLKNVPGILADGNMENVHRARVALRRMRSADKAFKKMRPAPPTSALTSDIQWLASMLGNLRDLQVFTAKTLPPIMQANDIEAIDFSPLQAHLDKRAERSLDMLRKTLQSQRYHTLITKLEQWPESDSEHAHTNLKKFSRRALMRRWRAIDKLVAQWDELDATQRHRLRKQVKQLRYAIDFFAALYKPKHVKKYLKYLEKLQTALGELNDAASARLSLRPLLRQANYKPAVSAVLGWLSCTERTQLNAAAATLAQWQHYTPFW